MASGNNLATQGLNKTECKSIEVSKSVAKRENAKKKVNESPSKPKQKNMCVSGYMLLKIRVGRSDYFFIV